MPISSSGSITALVTLLAAAWAVRALRAARVRRSGDGQDQQQDRLHNDNASTRPRTFYPLTCAALRMLVETSPFPFSLIEVVSSSSTAGGGEARQVLPPELDSPKVIRAPAATIVQALNNPEAWDAAFGSQQPHPAQHAHQVLVLLARSSDAVLAVAGAAAAVGIHRVAHCVTTAEEFASQSLQTVGLQYISRDALYILLQLGKTPLYGPSLVLDVRRSDERALFGALRHAVGVPAEELAAALALPAGEFCKTYGAAKPAATDEVVLLSRTGLRAAWSAQICADAGLTRVFVYRQGTYGWRLDEQVKPYRSYSQGGTPPEAEPFQVERPDEAQGLQEVHRLGLVLLQGKRPSRFAFSSLNGFDDACRLAAARQ